MLPTKKEALRLFHKWKVRWHSQLPKVVECLEKELDQLLVFHHFPYRHWHLIRSTNRIERAFSEFRRRLEVIGTFPTE